MKKHSKLLFCSATHLLLVFVIASFPLFCVEPVTATADSWMPLDSLPKSLFYSLGAAEVDGCIYFIGSNTTLQYNPQTDSWTNMTPLPVYNDGSAVVSCQNKVYVIGGVADMPTQVYDPATDSWENKTGISTTRRNLHANVVDDKIYVIGGQLLAGFGVINPSNSTDVYDPKTDTWSTMTPIATPVMGYASAVLDNKIYIIGGATKDSCPDYKPTTLVQIFNPQTNQWTNGISLPTGVCYAQAFVTTGGFAPKQIYVIAGSTSCYYRYQFSAVTNLTQVFNPETNKWTAATPMPTARCYFGAAVINDELYAIGGRNSSESEGLATNEKYTPPEHIPEFPTWTVLPILGATTLVAVICKQKMKQNSRKEEV
jgi:N-acetylneuraminic acid mutarotase